MAEVGQFISGFARGSELALRRDAQERAAAEAAQRMKLQKLNYELRLGAAGRAEQAARRDQERLDLLRRSTELENRLKLNKIKQTDIQIANTFVKIAQEGDPGKLELIFRQSIRDAKGNPDSPQNKEFFSALKKMNDETKQQWAEMAANQWPLLDPGAVTRMFQLGATNKMPWAQVFDRLGSMSRKAATQGAMYNQPSMAGGAETLARAGETEAAKSLAETAKAVAEARSLSPGQVPPSIEVKPEETLWNRASGTTGLVPGLKELGQGILGQVGINVASEQLLKNRQAFVTTQQNLIRALAINPRYPVGEMNAIRKETNIEPGMLTDERTLRARMISINDSLSIRRNQALHDSASPRLSKTDRDNAASAANAIDNYLAVLGVPRNASAVTSGPGAVQELESLIDDIVRGADPAVVEKYKTMSLEDLKRLDIQSLSDAEAAAAGARWDEIDARR